MLSTEIYEKNIAALRAYFPPLAENIDAVSLDPALTVHEKDGHVISVSYGGKDEDSILLHSKYNPVREAEKLVDGYALSPSINIVVLGFGFGYHVLDLIKRKGRRDFIIICEKNPSLIKEAFRHIDCSSLFGQKNIFWFIGERPERINGLLKNKALSFLANGVTVVLHPPSVQLDKKYYTCIKEAVEEFSVYARVNINTQIEKAERFVQNSFLNLDEYIRARPIADLFGIAQGVPVFIVGAGPSLDKTVSYLKEVRNRGFIIVVDSAVATLLQHGIIPDFVISIDFTKHTLQYFKNIDTSKLSLIFDLEIYPEVVKMFQGRKYAIHLPKKSVSEWVTGIIGDKGAIAKGLSVSHAALLIAAKMRAEEIILVGQDLAYPRSQWHAKGSHFFQTLDITNEEALHVCETEDIFGEKIKSSTALMIFKNHFEMLIHQEKISVYDATEGGAKIRGAKLISMKEAIVRFCTCVSKSDALIANSNEHYFRDKELVLNATEKMVDNLHAFNRNAAEANQLIHKVLDAFHATKRRDVLKTAINEVQGIIKRLDTNQELLDLLKDNSTEALLIREKKSHDSIFDLDSLSDQEILFKLKKEQMFFAVLVKASAFMGGQLQEFMGKHQIFAGAT
ncbi:motility associated factor glycosyltransferase family protein [Candidatus Omnitrophota bacterium]